MKLIVIRHGETDLNKENRMQGCKGPNLGLTADGREMVITLRDRLSVTPEIIYASPLLRTQETVRILNERFHLPIVDAPEIVERDFGSLSGMLRSEVDQKIVEADLEGHYDYRPYGGESVEDVTKRIQMFIAKLKTKKESIVMLVTHRGIIRILYYLYPFAVIPETVLPASQHIFEIP